MVNYLNFRETFITQDPSLDWIIDSAGLPVYEREGTDNIEAVKGSLTGGGYINGDATMVGGEVMNVFVERELVLC